MNELALFAGAGGGILGGHLLGWKTVCAVEWADYPRRVLLARQRDGLLPRFPIWDDVQTFDGKPWRGRIDVVSGGFPCQDISSAGKGAGIDGARSGMWFHMARIIREVQPRFAFVENSPLLTIRGLGRVLGDLAEMGYDARWGVLGACDAGSPHQRERIWILADSAKVGWTPMCIPHALIPPGTFDIVNERVRGTLVQQEDYPGNPRSRNAVAGWMDRLAATGNGQVPAVVKLAWETLGGPVT